MKKVPNAWVSERDKKNNSQIRLISKNCVELSSDNMYQKYPHSQLCVSYQNSIVFGRSHAISLSNVCLVWLIGIIPWVK